MVNQILSKYCLLTYFKDAHHDSQLRIQCISQEDFHSLCFKVGIMGKRGNSQKLDNLKRVSAFPVEFKNNFISYDIFPRPFCMRL